MIPESPRAVLLYLTYTFFLSSFSPLLCGVYISSSVGDSLRVLVVSSQIALRAILFSVWFCPQLWILLF